MESLKELYRIGTGPSSSHSMGPKRASEIFLSQNLSAKSFRVTLFGSLASTGKGHLTDIVIKEVFELYPLEIIWKRDEFLPLHPNGMAFESLDLKKEVISSWKVYSIGGGALKSEEEKTISVSLYPFKKMDDLLKYAGDTKKHLWEVTQEFEGVEIWNYLTEIWKTMKDCVERGLHKKGFLPGMLRVARKSHEYYQKINIVDQSKRKTCLLSAYALAVSEENAAGGEIVTAPTCGSSGILPAVLHYFIDINKSPELEVLHALATAGLIGNIVKENASISGAEVGCQGEIGTACAMAAGAAAQLLGGTLFQIEYAAELAIEHHLGLTCDPIMGLVQIPCIERNAIASIRAIDCAEYALLSNGEHKISFDIAIETMKRTGKDLNNIYRETSLGGLATVYKATSKNVLTNKDK